MIEFTAGHRYAVLAIVAIAELAGSATVTARDIAHKYQIPTQYCEQLLSKLKKAGLLLSFRGARGGYALAKPSSELTVRDIGRALEGEGGRVSHVEDPLSFFWDQLKEAMLEQSHVSIQDLIRQKKVASSVIDYAI